MWKVSGRLQELNHRGPFLEDIWTIYILEENSLHETTKLQHVQFNILAKSISYSLQSVLNTMNTEIKPRLSAHSQEDKNNGKFKRGHSKEWLQLLTRGGYLQ